MFDKKPSAFDPESKKTGAAFSPSRQAASASAQPPDQTAFQAERLAKSSLEGGEQLLWYGQPVPSQSFRAGLPFLFFSIPWTAFAIFWVMGAAQPILGALAKGETDWEKLIPMALFPLFGVPFIGIGLSLFRKPWTLAREAARTVYVLTNNRALILKETGKYRFEAFPLAKLRGNIHLRERRSGMGDIVFRAYTDDEDQRRSKGKHALYPGFLGLPNAAEVHKKIGRAIEVSA